RPGPGLGSHGSAVAGPGRIPRTPGSIVGDDFAVRAHGQQVQYGRADAHGERPDAAVAEGELTDAGVVAAHRGSEPLGRRQRYGAGRAGGAFRKAGDVPIVDATVTVGVAVAEPAEPDVLVAEEQRVAQPVGDVAEPGHRALRAQDRRRPPD